MPDDDALAKLFRCAVFRHTIDVLMVDDAPSRAVCGLNKAHHMAFRVFVSYSTRDIAVANALSANLRAAGAEVFVAEYSVIPGESLPTKIIKAIESCDLFLLLWSSNAQNSEWVPQEIGIAKAHRREIMPVVLHSGIGLTGFIKELKYLHWYRDPTAAIVWLNGFVSRQKARKDTQEVVTLVGIAGAILLAFGGKGTTPGPGA